MDIIITHDKDSLRADKYFANIHKLRNVNIFVTIVLTMLQSINVFLDYRIMRLQHAFYDTVISSYFVTIMFIMGFSYILLCFHQSVYNERRNDAIASCIQYLYKWTIVVAAVFNGYTICKIFY